MYALRAPLLGHCSNSKLQPGEPLIGHRDTCGSGAVWPDVGHPLRIIGEGIGLTVLVAAAPIPAVLHWRSNNNKTNPDIFSDQNSIEHLSINGNCSTNATSNTCSGKPNQQSSYKRRTTERELLGVQAARRSGFWARRSSTAAWSPCTSRAAAQRGSG